MCAWQSRRVCPNKPSGPDQYRLDKTDLPTAGRATAPEWLDALGPFPLRLSSFTDDVVGTSFGPADQETGLVSLAQEAQGENVEFHAAPTACAGRPYARGNGTNV
jgi:hypothetical protein